MRAMRNCSAFTAPPGQAGRNWMPICAGLKKPINATTANLANNWIYFICRMKRRGWYFGIRRAERSGHWQNYREQMFATESEKRDYAIKPMSCPGHVQVFNHALRSYRDLPLR